MKILIAVFQDLWNFTFGKFFTKEKKQVKVSFNLETTPVVKLNYNSPSKVEVPNIQNALVGEVGYVMVEKARLWQKPFLAFDSVIKTISYGYKITVMGYEGRFAKVDVDNQIGYLLKDEITCRPRDIFPVFIKEFVYLADNAETIRLRKLITDNFSTTDLYLPMQAEEFIMYQLFISNRSLPWGNERPRLAGNWHNLLKGKLGVKIGIEARAGSIMEYGRVDGSGFLCFVKTVRSDEQIVVLSIGRKVEGEYLEETLTKSEWQKLSPVFIQVS